MPELALDQRNVGGAFRVDENARRLIHYKFAENVCMTTEGGWASSAPLIKVKFALGQHCYEDSIHSFWIGQRLPDDAFEEGQCGHPGGAGNGDAAWRSLRAVTCGGSHRRNRAGPRSGDANDGGI